MVRAIKPERAGKGLAVGDGGAVEAVIFKAECFDGGAGLSWHCFKQRMRVRRSINVRLAVWRLC